MKEYIERSRLEQILRRYLNAPHVKLSNPISEGLKMGINGCIEMLKNEKSADVVEVVRCKDCKFHTDEEPGMVYCPGILGNGVNDDWFCKDGERKEEE